jgi:hypothetical protein
MRGIHQVSWRSGSSLVGIVLAEVAVVALVAV